MGASATGLSARGAGPTHEASAEPNLFELCLARRRKTKSRLCGAIATLCLQRGKMIKVSTMTQEERWLKRYQDVMDFMEKNHRNPSKYVDAERGLRNWVKQQKKLMNAGALERERLKMFNELLALGEKYNE